MRRSYRQMFEVRWESPLVHEELPNVPRNENFVGQFVERYSGES
jgi:hypothetical protein